MSLSSRPPGAPPKRNDGPTGSKWDVNSRRLLHQWVPGRMNMVRHVTQLGRQRHLKFLEIHEIYRSVAIGRDILYSRGEPIFHSNAGRRK